MLESYTELNQWRQQQMALVSDDHIQLNKFHDDLISRTVRIAMKNVEKEWGEPPVPFSFFLMGSAGRFEQSVWSDQDHGIIYDGGVQCQGYFLTLGSEISEALSKVGYKWCDGEVMASNPLWCQSVQSWKVQISDWLMEDSWESLRHFSTFFDSRVLIGEKYNLNELKEEAFLVLQEQPSLYLRLVENVDFIKKGVGPFGQLLPELHGGEAGNIQLKQTAFFPYVNALRLLAFKQKILSPSTLSRFRQLKVIYPSIGEFEEHYKQLLDFRLHFRKETGSYKEVHLIPIRALTRMDKQELKQLIKNGRKLFSEMKIIIDKECSL